MSAINAPVPMIVSCDNEAVQMDTGTKMTTGTTSITDKKPYIFRASAAGSADVAVDKIIGGTVAWNQLAKKINSTDWKAESSVTATFGDGEATFSYPSTGSNGIAMRTNVSFVKDHKYVVLADVKSPTVISAKKVFIGGSSTSRVRIEANITTTDTWIAKGTVANCAASTSSPIYAFVSGQAYTDLSVRNVLLIDLTLLLGSTIADYIYALEQSNSGAGVAWFESMFPNSYHAYNAGELMSVKTSAHVMRDANNNIIGNYALDPTLHLRGIPKLDANNNLYYDGDRYLPDGTVERRYGIVTLNGSESMGIRFTEVSQGSTADGTKYVAYIPAASNGIKSGGFAVCDAYLWKDGLLNTLHVGEFDTKGSYMRFVLLDQTITTLSALNTYLASHPLTIVYELATPTTETAEPYQELQTVDRNGYEEYVDERDVPIPVGHETQYIKRTVEVVPNGVYPMTVSSSVIS